MCDLHLSEILGYSDGDFVKGVFRGGAGGIDRPDSFRCDNFVVCGVTGCIFNHIELNGKTKKLNISHHTH